MVSVYVGGPIVPLKKIFVWKYENIFFQPLEAKLLYSSTQILSVLVQNYRKQWNVTCQLFLPLLIRPFQQISLPFVKMRVGFQRVWEREFLIVPKWLEDCSAMYLCWTIGPLLYRQEIYYFDHREWNTGITYKTK